MLLLPKPRRGVSGWWVVVVVESSTGDREGSRWISLMFETENLFSIYDVLCCCYFSLSRRSAKQQFYIKKNAILFLLLLCCLLLSIEQEIEDDLTMNSLGMIMWYDEGCVVCCIGLLCDDVFLFVLAKKKMS